MQETMAVFTKIGATKERELVLMKQITDQEFVNSLLANAKVSAPGMAAVQQNLKAKKKADAKRRK